MDSFEHQIVQRLVERTRADVQRLREALQREDRGEIRRLGHRLHGAAGALELHALGAIGARLDRDAAQANPAQLADIIRELDEEVARAQASAAGDAR